MAETSGFYDAEELVSGDYDREYVSEQFAEYFALFIGNGVFASPTNQLKVVAGEGMNIVVKEGWAFIRGRWYHNDSDLVIPVPPNTTAATINSGVFVQHSQSDRDIHSILATGRTTPDREAPYWELKIAELQIPTGTTAITDAMITDTRTDESVCGFVKGLLQGVIPTADLFAQYDAIFMDFYNRMKDQLSEDAAGHLQVEIDNLSGSIGHVSDSIAPQYDPSQTYGKGLVRMHNNRRYHSNQAITEPEPWTPEHWTEENIDEALSEIKGNSAVVGSMTIFAGSVVPNGYLLCDGQAVSRAVYAKLFSIIGTTWGAGDGSTTFNVPDMREVAPVGIGESTRTEGAHDTYTLGQFKDDQLQSHTHSIRYWATSGGANINGTAGSGLSSKSGTGNNNGRTGTVTRGKRIGVNYIIKY